MFETGSQSDRPARKRKVEEYGPSGDGCAPENLGKDEATAYNFNHVRGFQEQAQCHRGLA
jgi:hypothetical protein